MTTEQAIEIFEKNIIPCGEFDFNDKEIEVLKIILKAAKEAVEWKKYKEECDSYHTK